MALETELQIFESCRQEWLEDHKEKFVLIKDDEFSFHATDTEAYHTAVDKYGNNDIFIRQVLPEDRVEDSLSLLFGLVCWQRA